MAQENLAKLEEMLKADKDLQAKVNDLASAFEGDRADDKALFEATIGVMAAEAGLPVTHEEAVGAVPEKELSDEELDAVAGGGVCYFVGASPSVDSECYNNRGSSCAYVGVGFDDKW